MHGRRFLIAKRAMRSGTPPDIPCSAARLPGRCGRGGKLIEFYEVGRLEQYNFKDDLGERTNLARRLPRKAAELHAPLRRWRASVKAVMPPPITRGPLADARGSAKGPQRGSRATSVSE